MKNQDKAPLAGELLYRIESTQIGKGLYAQVLADELAKNSDGFCVPKYIQDAILWACGLDDQPVNQTEL